MPAASAEGGEQGPGTPPTLASGVASRGGGPVEVVGLAAQHDEDLAAFADDLPSDAGALEHEPSARPSVVVARRGRGGTDRPDVEASCHIYQVRQATRVSYRAAPGVPSTLREREKWPGARA
jgi:hypothetical protein